MELCGSLGEDISYRVRCHCRSFVGDMLKGRDEWRMTPSGIRQRLKRNTIQREQRGNMLICLNVLMSSGGFGNVRVDIGYITLARVYALVIPVPRWVMLLMIHESSDSYTRR